MMDTLRKKEKLQNQENFNMLLERKRKKDINKMTIVTIFVLILISFFSEKMESIKVVL